MGNRYHFLGIMEEFVILFKKHWSKFLLSVLLVGCIIAWRDRASSADRSQTRRDFFVVSEISAKFQKNEKLSSETIETVENILKRHPELHAKYDGLLTLAYLSQQNTTKALAHIHQVVGRVELPFLYEQYVQTSLLIAEGNYEQALTAAKQLRVDLVGKEGYERLSGMNLLRLAFLAETVGDPIVCTEAWENLRLHPLFPTIQVFFTEGKISLSDYARLSFLG